MRRYSGGLASRRRFNPRATPFYDRPAISREYYIRGAISAAGSRNPEVSVRRSRRPRIIRALLRFGRPDVNKIVKSGWIGSFHERRCHSLLPRTFNLGKRLIACGLPFGVRRFSELNLARGKGIELGASRQSSLIISIFQTENSPREFPFVSETVKATTQARNRRKKML